MINNIIEDKNFLTEEQKNILNNVILKDNFPFYYNSNILYDDNCEYFSHQILYRPEEKNENERINSNFYEFFKNILDVFCKKNKITYEKILRICVNCSIKTMQKESYLHKDHEYKSNHLIVYLNDLQDNVGYTYILDDDKKTLLKKVAPEKFKGVCFGWKYHKAETPNYGRRIVIVFTFI